MKNPTSRRMSRPTFEVLEDREVMTVGAVSSLGGTVVQFGLQSTGHLIETQGKVQTDLGLVQGLFQGKDGAGNQLAFELLNQQLSEFNGHAFAPVGGSGASLLTELNTLMITGGQGHVQIGSYLQATVNVQPDAQTGLTKLQFSNVSLNTGAFLGNVSKTIQSVTMPLQKVADALNQPLFPGQSWASSLTPLFLLNLYDPSAAAQAKSFADTITAINTKLPAANSSSVSLGSFTVELGGANGPAFVGGTQPSFGALNAVLNPILNNPALTGLQITIGKQQILNLITGAAPNIFSYTLPFNVPIPTASQHLATIPISPETGTELDLDLSEGLSVTGSATFGFDNQGFYVQNSTIRANATIALSGTINEACLVGYRITATVGGSLSATVADKIYANGQGKINVQIGDSFTGPTFSTSTLGPQQLISQYLNPTELKNLANQGDNAAKAALNRAWHSAQAANAQLLSGVGQTASAVATALNNLYGQQAQQTAAIINNLESGAASALNSGAKAIRGTVANIQNEANNSVNDVTRVLKGLYHQQDQQAAQILYGLNKSAAQIAGALHTVYADDVNAVAKTLANVKNGAASVFNPMTLANAVYSIATGSTSGAKLASTLWALVNPAGANLGIVVGVNGLISANLLPGGVDAVANFLLSDAGATVAQTLAVVEALAGGTLDQYANQLVQHYVAEATNWFNGIINGYNNDIAGQNQTITNAQNALKQAETNALNQQLAAFNSAGNALDSVQQQVNQGISSWLNWRNNGVSSWTAYMDSWKSWAQNALAPYGGLSAIGLGLWGGSVVSSFTSYANNLISEGAQAGTDVVNGIVQGVNNIGSAIQNTLNNNPAVQSFIASIKNQIMPALANAQQQINSFINQTASALQGFDNQLNNAEDAYNQALSAARTACNNAINEAQYTFNTAKAQATSLIQTYQQDLNIFQNQGTAQLNSMKSQIANLINQARQEANATLAGWLAESVSQRPANMVQTVEAGMQAFMKNGLGMYFNQVAW